EVEDALQSRTADNALEHARVVRVDPEGDLIRPRHRVGPGQRTSDKEAVERGPIQAQPPVIDAPAMDMALEHAVERRCREALPSPRGGEGDRRGQDEARDKHAGVHQESREPRTYASARFYARSLGSAASVTRAYSRR